MRSGFRSRRSRPPPTCPSERRSATRIAAAAGCATSSRTWHDMTVVTPFGREAIAEILPHREPFLLIDEVLELRPGEGAVARKTVRADEWYLSGHFPGRPVMPGVLIVEALAQTGAVAVLSEEENRGRLALFAGIDDCRFKRIVEPGDGMERRSDTDRVWGPVGRGMCMGRGAGTV